MNVGTDGRTWLFVTGPIYRHLVGRVHGQGWRVVLITVVSRGTRGMALVCLLPLRGLQGMTRLGQHMSKQLSN